MALRQSKSQDHRPIEPRTRVGASLPQFGLGFGISVVNIVKAASQHPESRSVLESVQAKQVILFFCVNVDLQAAICVGVCTGDIL